MNRICTKCKEEKEASEFYKNKAKADGVDTVCRTCKRTYIMNNKKRINERARERYKHPKKKLYHKEWHQKHKKYRNIYYKEYRKKNLEKYKKKGRIDAKIRTLNKYNVTLNELLNLSSRTLLLAYRSVHISSILFENTDRRLLTVQVKNRVLIAMRNKGVDKKKILKIEREVINKYGN